MRWSQSIEGVEAVLAAVRYYKPTEALARTTSSARSRLMRLKSQRTRPAVDTRAAGPKKVTRNARGSVGSGWERFGVEAGIGQRRH